MIVLTYVIKCRQMLQQNMFQNGALIDLSIRRHLHTALRLFPRSISFVSAAYEIVLKIMIFLQ